MSRGKAGPTVADGLAKLGVSAPKRSKYRNVPTVYNGVRYDSKAEANWARQLDSWMESGIVEFWVGQPRFRLGVPENVYVADFLVVSRTEPIVGAYAVDVKGKETAKFRRDKKLWKAYGPCGLVIVRGGFVVETIVPDRFKGG